MQIQAVITKVIFYIAYIQYIKKIKIKRLTLSKAYINKTFIITDPDLVLVDLYLHYNY